MTLEESPGSWCYFKRGVVSHHGKYHYLAKGAKKSRCGQWIVWPEEWKYIIYTTKENLRKRKVCQHCANLVKVSETILNEY